MNLWRNRWMDQVEVASIIKPIFVKIPRSWGGGEVKRHKKRKKNQCTIFSLNIRKIGILYFL